MGDTEYLIEQEERESHLVAIQAVLHSAGPSPTDPGIVGLQSVAAKLEIRVKEGGVKNTRLKVKQCKTAVGSSS